MNITEAQKGSHVGATDTNGVFATQSAMLLCIP
jgi:hypothetical protein